MPGITVIIVLCVSVCYNIFGDIAHLYVTTTTAISFSRYAPDFIFWVKKTLFTKLIMASFKNF